MPKNGIIKTQAVSSRKVDAARKMRKAMTAGEKAFWELVRNRGLFNLKFRRQQIINGCIIDFFCDELDLCIEIDGSIHDESGQRIIDDAKDAMLASMGLHVLRIRNEDILTDVDAVVETIRMLSENHSRPDTPSEKRRP